MRFSKTLFIVTFSCPHLLFNTIKRQFISNSTFSRFQASSWPLQEQYSCFNLCTWTTNKTSVIDFAGGSKLSTAIDNACKNAKDEFSISLQPSLR